MTERPAMISYLPKAVVGAIKDATLVIGAASYPLWCYDEYEEAVTDKSTGLRKDLLFNAPPVTLRNSKLLDLDWEAMAILSERVANTLSNKETIHVTTPERTDVVLSAKGRKCWTVTWGGPRYKGGGWRVFPGGEAMFPPVEDSINGKIVIDGTIHTIGFVRQPITLYVRDGKITKIEGGDNEQIHRLESLLPDEGAHMIGELGIGTNPALGLIGDIQNDKRSFGTVHFAFGDNHRMTDTPGKVKSVIHRDFVLRHPTVEVDGQILLKDGKFFPEH
jgi:leucyl aminopeptidase (aminopeptidase T)